MDTTVFLKEGTPEDFSMVLKLYENAVKIKSLKKKKKEGESLEQLDKWYQKELGNTVQSRSPPHITQDELVRLMKWKLSRGKFRPRLIELAGSNSKESVKTSSTKGIQLALKDKVEDAIRSLVVLKGVGPATASGILAACVPEKCCFFADEVAHAVPSLATLKYNAAEYELLNSVVIDCANRLNKVCEIEEEKMELWTPHRVELAVWTHSILYQNEPELISGLKRKVKERSGSTKRRKLD